MKFDELKKILKQKLFYILFGLLGIIALVWDLSDRESEKPLEKPEISSVDTLIPEGYVLVPIDIQNYASLDSMMGAFGVVDLYVQTGDRGASRKVAQKVKILRAPLNPSQFAVLIREENSSEIAAYPGSFFVMMQNPNKSGTRFEKRKQRNTIIMEDI